MSVKLAGCVITDNKNRIILIHRNNKKFNHWELPGGKIENGEKEQNAAKRELLEELGIKVRIIRKIGEANFVDKNGSFEYSWFRAEIIEGKPTVLERNIFNGVDYFSVESMANLDLSENMKNLYSKLISGEVTL